MYENRIGQSGTNNKKSRTVFIRKKKKTTANIEHERRKEKNDQEITIYIKGYDNYSRHSVASSVSHSEQLKIEKNYLKLQKLNQSIIKTKIFLNNPI